MKKNLLYVGLGLMGLMGTLVIGVVNASEYVTTVPGLIITGEQNGKIFEYGVLKFDDESGHIFMLLDRNLGAITTGNYQSYITGAYGYSYQRGNNHGFEPCYEEPPCDNQYLCNGCSGFPGGETVSSQQIDASGYGPSTYNQGIFIITSSSPFDWSSVSNDNLRGGSGDIYRSGYNKTTTNERGLTSSNPITGRQGPCPKGRHIPSLGERISLSKYRKIKTAIDDYNVRYSTYKSDFYIGNSKTRLSSNGNTNFYLNGNDFRTSSPIGFSVGNYVVETTLGDNFHRAAGLPVRCFSDNIIYKYSLKNNDVELISGFIASGGFLSTIINFNNIELNGYIAENRYLSGDDTTGFDFGNTAITGDITLYAKWTPIEYEIDYKLDGGTNSPNNVTGYTIEYNITFENPTKDGYSFDGWFTDTGFTNQITEITQGTTGDITLYAKWTKIETKPSGSSSGGGGSRNKTDTDTQKEDKTSADTENVIQSETKGSEESSKTPIDSSDKSSEGQNQQQFTEEFQEAYEFAKEKGITTMPTIQNANMNGKLTRIAMAKMLSYYAINVLGQKPDETRINKFKDITEKLDAQYDSGVTLAYQLGIMGINMPNNRFRPNDEVTRAEFATALSRMLYSTPDGKPYYTTHLEKLKAEGILTNDDYKMKELRGYVMIMLMRSVK